MTPDVNVLVAASRTDHPHHQHARTALETALDAASVDTSRPVVILPMIASGFLRLVTHPKVFVAPTPPAAARAFIDAVLAMPGVTMPLLGSEWPVFVGLVEQYNLKGNDVPDAWIAAAVQSCHEHLVTFDKGFRRWLPPERLTLLQPPSP